MRWGFMWAGAVSALLCAVAACGDSHDEASAGFGDSTFDGGASSRGPSGAGFNAGGAAGSSSGSFDDGTGAPPPLPPEIEVNVEFELPQAGQRFVYAANPESDTVAVIDATTLGIETVEAGDQPTFLQTLANTDAAIVLNVASEDATIIRTDGTGSRLSKVDVLRGSNAIAVAPDGRHAVVYFNSDFSSSGAGSGSFQDVTVITLDEAGDSAVGMTVGFRPIDVQFSADGTQGFVITEDGVSLLDFEQIENDGAGIARTIAFSDPGVKLTLDVSITPDGRYALAREDEDSTLRLLDLDTEEIRLLDLATILPEPETPDAGVAPPDAASPPPDAAPPPPPDSGAPAADAGDAGTQDAAPATPPIPDAAPAQPDVVQPPPPPPPTAMDIQVTDVDLAPSGDYAMAVVRERSSVLRVPIPEAFEDASAVDTIEVENELIGSVTFSPDGRYALLFTTISQVTERLTILDLEDGGDPNSVQLRKSVRSVAIAPDGETALVIHDKLDGNPFEPGLDPDVAIDRAFGYSLVQLSSGFSKLQVTEAELGPFTLVPDGSYLFILFDQGALREVQRIGLSSFLVERISLGSPPISVGAVPQSQKVFVGQEHPDGRITFIDWMTAEVQSVTGFELNSRIRE